jgi:Zn-dependent protease
MQPDIVFTVAILVISVVLHEVSHGYMANYLGDPTARLLGRLTLNPLKHIDPIGSVALPFFLVISGSPLLIGYAKPVPYNPYNLPGRYDEALVAGAGPAVNIALALIFAALIRLFGSALDPALLSAFSTIVFINMLLALFNLLPIPPLDGSKILGVLLPGPLGRAYDHFRMSFERLGVLAGTFLILLLLFIFAPYFFSFISLVFNALTGLPR